MNYVFFDIECASVFKNTAKICAFGYVICDEQFNIIKKEDILINPKGRFHLTDRRGEHGLVLPYEYSEFKNHPVFSDVYPQIKALLEDKNNLVFGHSVLNDVKYLELETCRFSLPSFEFKFSDSQLMYMAKVNDFSRQFGLEYITKDLNVEFTPHRAADDAYATMKTVEALCRAENLTYPEFEKKFRIVRGRIKRHKITPVTCGGYSEYCAERERKKRERGKARSIFYNFVCRRHKTVQGNLSGLNFNFSRPIEDDIEISLPLLKKIYEKGGKYAAKFSECNVYVCSDGDTTVRTQNARKTDGLKIITPEELKGLIDGTSQGV